MTRDRVGLMLLRCIASMCRQLTKCTRNVCTPDMKFAWRTALSHVKSVFVQLNVCVRSGLHSFFVRKKALYVRPLDRKQVETIKQSTKTPIKAFHMTVGWCVIGGSSKVTRLRTWLWWPFIFIFSHVSIPHLFI